MIGGHQMRHKWLLGLGLLLFFLGCAPQRVAATPTVTDELNVLSTKDIAHVQKVNQDFKDQGSPARIYVYLFKDGSSSNGVLYRNAFSQFKHMRTIPLTPRYVPWRDVDSQLAVNRHAWLRASLEPKISKLESRQDDLETTDTDYQERYDALEVDIDKLQNQITRRNANEAILFAIPYHNGYKLLFSRGPALMTDFQARYTHLFLNDKDISANNIIRYVDRYAGFIQKHMLDIDVSPKKSHARGFTLHQMSNLAWHTLIFAVVVTLLVFAVRDDHISGGDDTPRDPGADFDEGYYMGYMNGQDGSDNGGDNQ